MCHFLVYRKNSVKSREKINYCSAIKQYYKGIRFKELLLIKTLDFRKYCRF